MEPYLHNFVEWLEYSWGMNPNDEWPSSYAQQMLSSSNFWGLLEGTHLLMLMLFFGSILFVDLRLLGVTFRKTPVSVVSDRVLPLTIVSMVIVLGTGVLLFLSKPEDYWHNFWFRSKMILLAVAMLNVFIFHKLVQKNQAEWDASPKTPIKAKVSALISIGSWVLIILCGRFIAYNFVECGKPQADWINSYQACQVSSRGAMSIEDGRILEAEMKAAEDAGPSGGTGLPELPALPELPPLPELPATDEAAQTEAN